MSSQSIDQKKYTTSFQQLMAQRYPQPANIGMNTTSPMQGGFPSSIPQPQNVPLAEGAFAPPGPLGPPGSIPGPGSIVNSSIKLGTSGKQIVASSKVAKAPTGSATGTKPKPTTAASQHLTYNTPQQIQLLSQCDYRDKTIWATRLLMGGNSVNGFLRAAATAQRIKKQRARQNNSTKQSRAAAAAKAAGINMDTAGGATSTPSAGDDKSLASTSISGAIVPIGSAGKTASTSKPGTGAFDQAEEEQLKKEIMNPRTAKKLKSELEQGLVFCAAVCNVLRGVLFDIDNSLASSLPPALIIEPPKPPPKPTFLTPSSPTAAAILAAQKEKQARQQQQQAATAGLSGNYMDASNTARASFKAYKSAIPGPSTSTAASKTMKHTQYQKQHANQQQQQQQSQAQKTTASPGDPNASTLRKLRKKKLAHPAPAINLPEFDSNGKRTCTKKQYQYRIFQLLRYRDLKQGDYCAARLSSRDLWILAKVLKHYNSGATSLQNLKPVEFLQLSDVKRDALFREKVLLKDVEEREDSGSTPVARNLVLPLPRSYEEASEWATRLKKGSRVYAMYPQTTSLYAATVIDTTTYCRGDDDIIVVEFDGEEPDLATGQLPTYHIPARFVTLIPREFPASQNGTTGSTQSNKRKSATASGGSNKKRSSTNSTPGASGGYLDMISMDFGNTGADAGLGFDALDLDFDKPLDENEQQDTFPPF